MTQHLREAFQFFLKNGAARTGFHAVDALDYARSEARAAELGFTVEWKYETESSLDVFGMLECCERANRKCQHVHNGSCLRRYTVCQDHWDETHADSLCAILKDQAGEILDTLGCIEGATANYRRVVEAELASEALDRFDRQAMQERTQAQAWLNIAAL